MPVVMKYVISKWNKHSSIIWVGKAMYASHILTLLMQTKELIDRIAQNDMIRGVTIAAGGFFGPQGRELRIPLADPKQNEKN